MTAAAQPGTSARPVAVFVLGMARSGTSALTRVLSLSGGTLPAGMKGADRGNPEGYWEPRKASTLNEAILRRQGSSRFDPSLRLQEEGAFDAEERAACIAKVRAYLTTLPAAPLVVIKDPLIAVLSDVWFEAARLAGFDIAARIAVRHPQEAIASFAGTPSSLAGALECLVAEIHSAGRETRARPAARVRRVRRPPQQLAPGNKADFHGAHDRSQTSLNVDLSYPPCSKRRR